MIYKKLYPSQAPISFSIQPQSEAVIESFTGGKSGPYYNNGKGCGGNDFDSLVAEVVNANMLKIKKDINNSDNWIFKKNGVDVECRATITDADIVPK